MREVKLTINGKTISLTDEQREALYREYHRADNPFKRVPMQYDYFYIDRNGTISSFQEINDKVDEMQYDTVNYFNDEEFAEQVALHQLLYRKLLKFAYDNNVIDTEEWNGKNKHWYILYESEEKDFLVDSNDGFKIQGAVYFSSKESVERAVHEVVEPFVREHPEFVW